MGFLCFSIAMTFMHCDTNCIHSTVMHSSMCYAAKGVAEARAKPSGKTAAKPAASEPIPVAPVEHVQFFKVIYSRQKKW